MSYYCNPKDLARKLALDPTYGASVKAVSQVNALYDEYRSLCYGFRTMIWRYTRRRVFYQLLRNGDLADYEIPGTRGRKDPYTGKFLYPDYDQQRLWEEIFAPAWEEFAEVFEEQYLIQLETRESLLEEQASNAPKTLRKRIQKLLKDAIARHDKEVSLGAACVIDRAKTSYRVGSGQPPTTHKLTDTERCNLMRTYLLAINQEQLEQYQERAANQVPLDHADTLNGRGQLSNVPDYRPKVKSTFDPEVVRQKLQAQMSQQADQLLMANGSPELVTTAIE
ncbi:MAG: hypothetical protein MUC48_20715 [Leptolyngbya sp. Prado105]|jgi:hypothetical protein|nr:hypothetical protein [Leptolyngbya sp. Prado105]